LRAIEESVMLMRHMAQHLRELNELESVSQFLARAEEAQQRGNLIRRAVLRHETLSQETVSSESTGV
jgi:two-component system chemotaxis response regulator CheB